MLIVYLYDQAGNITTQLFKSSGFESRRMLNDIGTASFELDPSESGATSSNLREFAPCRVCIVLADGTESEAFDGVIRDVVATGTSVKVTLNDRLYLLKKKKLYSQKSYVSVSIGVIIAEILADANARYDSGIVLSTSVSTLASKEYKNIISIFDILKDLSESGYEFRMNGKTLEFGTTLGNDLTVDPGFVEFRSDVSVPQEINVAEYSIRKDSENISNAVTTISSGITAMSTDSASIAYFGRIEESYTVDGDVVAAAASNLSLRKDSVSEISVVPIDSENIGLAEVGDSVKVYIDGGSDLRFFSGTLRISEKRVTYSGSVLSTAYQLSEGRVSTPTLIDELRHIRDRVKKLET